MTARCGRDWAAPGERGQGPAGARPQRPGERRGGARRRRLRTARRCPPPGLIREERRRGWGDCACSRCPNAKPGQLRSGGGAPAAGSRLRLARGGAELPAAVRPGAPRLFMASLPAVRGWSCPARPGAVPGHPLCWRCPAAQQQKGVRRKQKWKVQIQPTKRCHRDSRTF